jgi:hypothetical protein
VFYEQIHQWQADKNWAYLIAENYQACAQKCCKGTHQRGLADGRAANDIYIQELPCNIIDQTLQPPMQLLTNLATLPKTMISTAAFAGLALPNPSASSEGNYKASTLMCSHILAAFRGAGSFSFADHQSVCKMVTAEIKAHGSDKHDSTLHSILADLDCNTRITILH